ncbi:MAG: hypothetical protein E4H14_02720 [Candidatus Thorarchaeota archaeon]|nr:MAG: hypothetical protein E4H14_02720 [Candidatus Thorarchaeota archaeon]
MTELEILGGLSWPAAFTIVGSVIAVVGGILALYGTYIKTTNGSNGQKKSGLPSVGEVQIHDRISGNRDRIGTLEGEQKVLAARVDNLIKELSHHDARDVDDFKTINAKVDKLMELIVEMLKGDR